MDLFGLCLGIRPEPRLLGRERDPEREHPVDVARDRDDRDDPCPAESSGLAKLRR